MNKDGSNPVRDEAVVRAHAWAVRLWNERKISADFTSEDEAELVEMLLGFLAVAPYPEPAEGADFAALKNENYYLQVDNVKLRFYIEELESASRTIDTILAQQAAKEKYEAAFGPNADTFRWIFDGPREIVELRRQLAEAQGERDTARKDLLHLQERLNAAIRSIQVREETYSDRLDRIRENHRLEIAEYKRELSKIDDETAEFNAGYEACQQGLPIEAEPDDLAFDVWRHGWIVANYERTQTENATMRQQLALAESIIASLGNPYVQEYPLSQETVIPPDVSGSAP